MNNNDEIQFLRTYSHLERSLKMKDLRTYRHFVRPLKIILFCCEYICNKYLFTDFGFYLNEIQFLSTYRKILKIQGLKDLYAFSKALKNHIIFL